MTHQGDGLHREGLPGDYHDDANELARRAWPALRHNRGMRLSADEVVALHQIQCDGEWWQSMGHSRDAAASGEVGA